MLSMECSFDPAYVPIRCLLSNEAPRPISTFTPSSDSHVKDLSGVAKVVAKLADLQIKSRMSHVTRAVVLQQLLGH